MVREKLEELSNDQLKELATKYNVSYPEQFAKSDRDFVIYALETFPEPNSNAVPFTVNGEEVITEGNISSHLPATFDAKSVWFSTPVKQGANGMLISSEFTEVDLHKYFVPGNLLLANMVCGGNNDVQYEVVVPMQIVHGDGGLMMPTGVVYADIADVHFSCIIAVSNEEAAGDYTGLPDGTVLLYSVAEAVTFTDRTANSELLGFTVFDLVSHKI